MIRVLAILLFCCSAPAAFAQAAEQRPIPPGGSRPADGALKGGSIDGDVSTSPTPRAEVQRCRELLGKLREQCLRDLGAAAGSSSPPPGALPSPAKRDPVAEPPPQNPQAR
jgi:hypothetical protein